MGAIPKSAQAGAHQRGAASGTGETPVPLHPTEERESRGMFSETKAVHFVYSAGTGDGGLFDP